MKKIFIKYNPYKLETEVMVDGKKLAQNSKLRDKIMSGSRLQEWIEELPKILIDEYNDTDFDVTFHGTLLDFEDLTEVFTLAYKRGELTAKLDRKPAKETGDKEVLIDEVFEEIQKGPFEQLKDKEILSAFNHVKSSDFEVCVVATMSAGKSTLINSMIGDKLMPSKQEACTAIITRIKDTDNKSWEAEVYSKDNQLIETHKELNYETMERLNSDNNVSLIKVNGDIPFVTSEDVSLVLVDTPGPNNSRDPEHKKVQSEFLSKSSKSLVLYIMEGTFGSDDDNALLKRVADSMTVGGKQSKDRFIFVINKMDDRRKEDGDTEQTLNRVREYLKNHGIINPNIFPIAALPALNIRLMENDVEVDEDTLDETWLKVRKLNRNESFHFESYANLPASIKADINGKLSEAKEAKDDYGQALIHTGVVSVEAAIRQYVQKYAKTAKIKNIVDTFMHKLDEVGCFEEAKREIAENRDESEKILKHIDLIRKKIQDTKVVGNFKESVDEAIIRINDDSRDVVEKIIEKFQKRIEERINELKGKELTVEEARNEVDRLEKFAEKLSPDFETDLEGLLRKNLINVAIALLDEYKKKLASLTEEFDSQVLSGINIDPLKLMNGTISFSDGFSVERFIQTKEVEDGEEWVANTDKKWYKPWTWFQESGYYRTKYKDVQYVNGEQIAQEFFAPVQEFIWDNGENAQKHALKQSKKISSLFNEEFKNLDNILKDKLTELEMVAKDKERVEERILESECKLKWLEDIKEKVESILEI
ncbi:dynamin family protein [Clostridium perfringens]|uniref:dynamin family protein n=1 Tax=Clostridium perfringens TaxID=1502 RepID=UPI0013E3C75C|nr:dynamin family protein [Clostridium perfringens]MDB2044091.1 dynamin family protein [Clostridium perfringens]MDB2055158.1 dynamin family protein [Clostridium perfringens]MDK0653350.1 dynamin family protein [Clostridium perfringens]MDK0816480.1 dynamin family protein [Clostridium perfringens]MDM0604040.1 dynamin family protein [Clostridium perfringens]